MSTANWNRIVIAETITEAFPFRNVQTLVDQENDARLWCKTPMQHFRSGKDAQIYLDGLFNVLDKYLEWENQTPKEVTQNPNHGTSLTSSEWGARGIAQSDAATLEDVETRSIATAARLHRSARAIHSWTTPCTTDCHGLKEDRSTWKELVRTFATSVRDLQSENHELCRQLAKMRQNPAMIVGSTIGPVTLRTIITMRVMEANFGQLFQINDQTLLFNQISKLSPIRSNALDITLTPDRANQLGHLLSSGTAYRELYDGIHIHTCTKCCKPRFRFNKANRCPLFRDLNEYPKPVEVLSWVDICSPCGLETLLRAIWRDWWHNLGSIVWLRHHWDQGCCASEIICEGDLVRILDSLGCRDVNDVDDLVKKSKKATKYREALKNLDRRPNAAELDAAADLHAHLIKQGRMRNFFDAPINPKIGRDGRITKFSPGPIIVGDMGFGNLKIPIFSSLFRRQSTRKECIVCTEEKSEVDYGTLDQWMKDYAHTGMWMWDVLEYPTRAIQQCDHALNVCRVCMAQHISTSTESGKIDRTACPQCNRVLSFEEIRSLARADTFERYERILLRQALSSQPDFRWCLSRKCENGQVHEDVDMSLAAIECMECGFRMCFRHQTPWHSGVTCAEFDSDPKFIETQEYIMNNTKACPGCGARIKKGPGCFHMTCSSCNHEFCWECLVDWQSVRNNCLAHGIGCYFRGNNVRPTAMMGTDLQAALQAR